jgi:hypothetical protein
LISVGSLDQPPRASPTSLVAVSLSLGSAFASIEACLAGLVSVVLSLVVAASRTTESDRIELISVISLELIPSSRRIGKDAAEFACAEPSRSDASLSLSRCKTVSYVISCSISRYHQTPHVNSIAINNYCIW